jgi:hypothetical protein
MSQNQALTKKFILNLLGRLLQSGIFSPELQVQTPATHFPFPEHSAHAVELGQMNLNSKKLKIVNLKQVKSSSLKSYHASMSYMPSC